LSDVISICEAPFQFRSHTPHKCVVRRVVKFGVKFYVQIVQNLFLVIWFDSYIVWYMLNRIITTLRCLGENLYKIYFLAIWFNSCILWIESFKLSSVWLMKIDFESIQIILNLFDLHMKSFELIQVFFFNIFIW
jgi:hypothetical protein